MRSIHSASNEASCTVTTSCGMAQLRNGVRAEAGGVIWPSAQNSVFLRDTLDEDDDLLLDLREDVMDADEDDAAALLLVLLADPVAVLSSSMGR